MRRSAVSSCRDTAVLYLNQADVGNFARLVHGHVCDSLNPVLNRIGDMRDDLHRLAEVVATSLCMIL